MNEATKDCAGCYGMIDHDPMEVCPRLERSTAWDDATRAEPTPAQLDRVDAPEIIGTEGPKHQAGNPVPDWAFAFQVGTRLNLNGYVCRIAGHYVDDVSEEPIGFVLIPEEHTAAFVKREREKYRNEQIGQRRKAMKAVKGRKK